MDNIQIVSYNKSKQEEWNNFVKLSKNGTFLFYRNFMEYHSDRFLDASLMIFYKNRLVSLFIANQLEDSIYSHQGLTYGGFILKDSIGVSKLEDILKSVLVFYYNKGIKLLTIKSIPVFYHKTACFELDSIFLELGSIYRREQNFGIDYRYPINFHKTKLKHYRKQSSIGFEIKISNNFEPFWNEILIPRLSEKHSASPVHTLDEIQLLNERFPENIVQYDLYLDENLLAGITCFKTHNVVKSQYGATSQLGEKYRALDYLFISLIQQFKQEGYEFFDMGIVSGNYSLLKQKEELGANQYLQDFYKININENTISRFKRT